MTLKTFCHRFSRIFLFITNVVVTLIGALALAVGIWGAVQDRDYTDIADDDDTNVNAYPIVLIVVGVFILLLGGIGFIGAICGSKFIGRVLLMVYAIAMGIIVLLSLAGGIAAYVRRDDVEDTFRENANRTLQLTGNRTDYLDDWNSAQRDIHCCGVNGYMDWLSIDWYRGNETIPDDDGVIPLSCCASVGGCGLDFILPEEVNGTYQVWSEGCVDAVVDRVSDQVGVIAGVSITVAVILILAVVMACFVSIVKSEASSYEVV